MELYLFNPDADMALADNGGHYIAPASVRRMTADLAWLPLWYAAPGSGVLMSEEAEYDFAGQMRQYFPLDVMPVVWNQLPEVSPASLYPWGWNVSLRRSLLKAGVCEDALPTVESLNRLRALAGRDVALRILQALAGLPFCCGSGVVLLDVQACSDYARRLGSCVFKTPWSGSGKGLLWCRSGFTEVMSSRCARIIREQGFLTGFPIYNKVLDFALEYQSDGQGNVDFIGYSLFDTDERGAYSGNRLLSNEAIEQQILHFLPLAAWQQICIRLQQELASCYGWAYKGFLGVDMMICRVGDEENGEYRVFPCVEVNLRMNMGVVARLFFDRFMLPSANGCFRVEYFSDPASLHRAHEADKRESQAVIHDGKLLSGYLPLVPVGSESRYRAYVKVAE